MIYATLLSPARLQTSLNRPDWVVVDCRFSLSDTTAGRRAYLESHIPGAVYAHLDEDLSNPPTTDRGRHPLPPPDHLIALFSRLGISANTQVVVYDDARGMVASRLWWMLRYMGHEAVAVLDGGWQAWVAEGLPTRAGEERNEPASFSGSPRLDWLVTLERVPDQALLVDSRDGARYRGEVETIDPYAGHIPGAVNYFYGLNVAADGRFLPGEQVKQQLEAVLGDTRPQEAVFYCGSGVSACVNLLALKHAGLPDGKLYVGSWSEWCADPTRPQAKL
ncbi:MAG: sulfurtransferase [Chloroflexi bacterium]|nr:sulfurtransferase [Chloroflexota bacterium]